MTSSEQTTPPAASPSSTPPPPRYNPQQLTTPPLRVAPPSSPPIPSSTNPSADSGAGFDPIDHSESGNTRSSDRADGPVGRFDASAIKDIARGLVLLSSRYVHGTLARTDEQIEQEVWIARNEDQRNIGDPLAKIAQRHGAVDAAPDVVNLIEAGLGALAYVLYHAGKAWNLRRGRKKLDDVDPITEHGS